jgi:hemolysin TlyA family protein
VADLKERLDILLVDKGFFASREKAKASIMAGLIYVDGAISDKPGTKIDLESEIVIKEDLCPYVSRGGLKLEKAMELWGFGLDGKVCMDMGASTGGFTDCMLQHGAARVYAVDVGYGQLDWKLRNDPRVVNMEKTNIRYLDTALICEPVDFISIDVSFISLDLMFPVAAKVLADDGQIVALVKPQFEAGREQVGKKGIVRDLDVRKEVLRNVAGYAAKAGFSAAGLSFSPVTGAKGNVEFLLYLTKKFVNINIERKIDDIVFDSHRELE